MKRQSGISLILLLVLFSGVFSAESQNKEDTRYSILLTGASFASPENKWFEIGCRELNANPVNRAIGGDAIANTANFMSEGVLYTKEQLENLDALVIMHVHDKDVFESSEIKENFQDYKIPFDRSNYAAAFDYVIKRYTSDCYELRNDPTSKYYKTRTGKPVVIVLCTNWHDGRPTYNHSVRKLAAKWGLPLVKFDEYIGFSKSQVHPVTKKQASLLYSQDEQKMDRDELFGWHPIRGENSHIQQKMAAIFVEEMKKILPANRPLHANEPLSRNIDKETFIYSIKDGVSLKLDKYRLKQAEEKQACIFFLFGGSFRRGARDGEDFLEYYYFLANQGYTVLAIDYRLGLKEMQDPAVEKVVPALKNAIYMAVEDLYDATNYALLHASDWRIDPEKMVISGSSAGAITVLQAEYERNKQSAISKKLQAGFKYAGVIGFAGAIFSQGELKWDGKAAPMLFFHGDMDATVPFFKLEIAKMQFCGSQEIAKKLKLAASPYCLYQISGAKHEISSKPMKQNLPEIQRFMSLFVENKHPLMIHSVIDTIDKKNAATPLKLEDFIKNNFK